MENKLDEFQLKIYNHQYKTDSAYIVKAVAGAGKSTTVLAKAIQLIKKGTPPDKILLTTFTNSSARDLQRRYNKQAQENKLPKEKPYIGTLHSLGRELLKQLNSEYNNYSIMTEWESILCMREALTIIYPQIEHEPKTTQTNIARTLQQAYSKLRNQSKIHNTQQDHRNTLQSTAHKQLLPTDISSQQAIDTILKYRELKQNQSLLDYDDMIWLPNELMRNNKNKYINNPTPFKYLFIDEAQDLSQSQYDLITYISEKQTLTMVGDTCQSIYGFRDATPENFSIEYLQKYFTNTKIFTLENNYRSQPPIVSISNLAREVANDDIKAIAKQPKTIDTSVKIVQAKDNVAEGKYITDKIQELLLSNKPQDILIMARSNRHLKTVVEPSLVQANIPYSLIGGNNSKRFTDKPVSQFYIDSISFALNLKNTYTLTNLLTSIKGIGATNIPSIINEYKTYIKTNNINNLTTKRERIHHIIHTYHNINLQIQDNKSAHSILEAIQELLHNETLASVRQDERTEDMIYSALANYISLQLDCNITQSQDIFNSMLQEISIFEGNQESNTVKVATIHSQKGQESPITICCGFNSQKEMQHHYDPQEANCLYVALSRAINQLFIIDSLEYRTKSGDIVSNFKNPYFTQLLIKIKERK